MKLIAPYLILLLAFTSFAQERHYVTVKKIHELMGCKFEFTVVAENEELGYIYIQEAVAEVQRIEKLISSWDPNSETSLINKNAGIRPVKVSLELFKLIERAKKISEITNGAFDITYASLDNLWKFDGTMTTLATRGHILEALAKVGYKNIILDETEHTVFLKLRGMKISFGAIGKGLAADKAKELLVSKQVRAGVINAAGDMTTWGTKSSGEKWLIGIANPVSEKQIFSWLPVLESSVATARSNDKYVTVNGINYSHIIDPRTGYPITTVKNVTVFAKSAELCDALATAILVLGKDAGLSLINQLGDTEAIILENDSKIYKSSGMLIND